MDRIEQVYGDTPKKDIHRIRKAQAAARAEILERHLPGVELRYWRGRGGPHGGMTPAIERVYLSRDGEQIGYIGVRRSQRRPEGDYERHRWTKGEDQYEIADSSECPEAEKNALAAAVAEYVTRLGEEHRLTDLDQFTFTYGALAD